MKVLQTIGHRNGEPPTPFYYRRDAKGVYIESAKGERVHGEYSHALWASLIKAIMNHKDGPVFGVSSSERSDLRAPKLHGVMSENPFNIRNSRLQAYVTAVLFHEGTIMLEHGPRANDLDARVYLRASDVSAKKHQAK